jgi:catechol 2,3-dioxygenase-like lactoylglutathione lyase family enzyme
MITGLNHITIAVSDLAQSLKFYRDILGFKAHVKWQNGAYLSVGDMWFCLSCDESSPAQDYTHIAFSISEADFRLFSERVVAQGVNIWKENRSEGLSLYILDPDGHKLELHSGSLSSRLESLKEKPYKGLVWL